LQHPLDDERPDEPRGITNAPALLATAGVAMWEWDARGDVVRCSHGIEELFGVPEGGFAQTYEGFLALVHPADRDVVMQAIGGVVRGEHQSYALEHRVVWNDGSTHWLSCKGTAARDADGAILTISGVVFDITPTKHTQEALRQSEELVRTAMEHSPIGFAIVAPDGKFLYANPAFAELVGYSRQELESGDFQGITHADDLAADLAFVAETLSGQRARYAMEKRYVRKNGDVVWAQLDVSLVREPDGAPRYFVSQIQDITERRRIQEQLRHSQKMDAFGQLAGGVAHDFNNLLAVILPHAELAEGETAVPKTVRDSLAMIGEAARQAARLTRQLLQLSRRDVLRPRVVDLNDAVTRFAAMLRRLLREDVTLDVRLSSEPARVIADPSLLDQIMMNLAVNARDAMPKGGTLTIETTLSNEREPTAFSRGDASSGPLVGLRVTDTGCGVAREHLPRLFEPFFTTKPQGKGTGLGLATVSGIVEQHRGAIDVSSTVGAGTTFSIWLPRSDRRTTGDAPGARPAPRGGSETILVVEDDPAVRSTTALALERHGYAVIGATSGDEALNLLAQPHDIALVITDLVMPGKASGSVLVEELQARQPQTRVIVTSGYSPDVFGTELGLREGVNFVPKPVALGALLDIVRRTLDG
jgi:PAS domain S-box-containing protein